MLVPLGAGDIAMGRTDKVPPRMGLIFKSGKQTASKETTKMMSDGSTPERWGPGIRTPGLSFNGPLLPASEARASKPTPTRQKL